MPARKDKSPEGQNPPKEIQKSGKNISPGCLELEVLNNELLEYKLRLERAVSRSLITNNILGLFINGKLPEGADPMELMQYMRGLVQETLDENQEFLPKNNAAPIVPFRVSNAEERLK